MPAATDRAPLYRQVQIGWPILVVTSPLLLGLAYLAVRRGELMPFAAFVAVIIAIELLFVTFTVEVDRDDLSIRFGIGLVHRRIPLNTIRRFAGVTSRWYYGWGVRVTPDGMLYNVSGRSAVELLLDDGRRVSVGTPNPEALIGALEGATRLSRSSSTVDFPRDEAWRHRNRLLAGIMVIIVLVWTLVNIYLSRP